MEEKRAVIIKKYQNRKLYNTEESRYVTLTELADIIAGGSEIKVVDKETSVDITALILTEVLYELEKSQNGQVPLTVLKEIIRSGDGSLFKFMQKFVIASVNYNVNINTDIKDFIEKMRAAEELSELDYRNLLKLLEEQTVKKPDGFEEKIQQTILNSLSKIKSIYKLQKQISKLKSQVISLEEDLDRIEAKKTA